MSTPNGPARFPCPRRTYLLSAALPLLLVGGLLQGFSAGLPEPDRARDAVPDTDLPDPGLSEEEASDGEGGRTQQPVTDRSPAEAPRSEPSSDEPSPKAASPSAGSPSESSPNAGSPSESRLIGSPLIGSPLTQALLIGSLRSEGSHSDPSQPGALQQEEERELHCPGTALLKFDPGVGPTPQEQKVTGEMRGGTDMDPRMPCTSPSGIPYQGGTAELKGAGEIACASAGAVMDIAGTADIIWDNGDTSKAEWSVVSYGGAPVVDVRITEGALAPAQVFQQGTPTGFNGNCAERPLTNASFTGVAHLVTGEGPEAPE